MSAQLHETTHPIHERVIDTYNSLKFEEDLSPRNEQVNQLLSELVAEINRYYSYSVGDELLNHSQIQSIQENLYDLLATAEAEMECFEVAGWLRQQEITMGMLHHFRYWSHYQQLVLAEAQLLPLNLNDPRPLAFVGSGSLPLTAILLMQHCQWEIVCIDCDWRAIQHAKQLCQRLALTNIHFELMTGECMDYGSFQGVIIASLIPNKARVIKRIRNTQSQAWLAVRTVEGIYRLLYRPIDQKQIERQGFRFRTKTQANQWMINTTHLFTPVE